MGDRAVLIGGSNNTLRGRNDELERGWSKEKEGNKSQINECDTAQKMIEN
jgi:hypothetical protein